MAPKLITRNCGQCKQIIKSRDNNIIFCDGDCKKWYHIHFVWL